MTDSGHARRKTDNSSFLLKWWPVITFLVVWAGSGIGTYYSIRSDLRATDANIGVVSQSLGAHEQRQQEERRELLNELRELRTDVKRLLERK